MSLYCYDVLEKNTSHQQSQTSVELLNAFAETKLAIIKKFVILKRYKHLGIDDSSITLMVTMIEVRLVG